MPLKRYVIDKKTGSTKGVRKSGGKAKTYKITDKKTGASALKASVKRTAKPAAKKIKVPKTAAKYTGDVPVKSVKTKGGTYNVYRKGSATAKNFRSAFSAARKAGKATFTWQGKKYTTKVKKAKKK